jgi:hypothetical protein
VTSTGGIAAGSGTKVTVGVISLITARSKSEDDHGADTYRQRRAIGAQITPVDGISVITGYVRGAGEQ